MTPHDAYEYALNHHTEHDFDLEYYQKIACEDFDYACDFAQHIPGADIKYCQEHACIDPVIAYYFALDVTGADIAYCQAQACKLKTYALWFAQDIPGADIEYCRKVCGPDEYWSNLFDKMIIEKAML